MITEETVSGYWYVPGKDHIHFNGQLTFGPEHSPRLLLTATKTHDLSSFPFDTVDYTIWGYSISGDPITLFGCNRLTVRSGGGGVQTADFNTGSIAFGAHISSADEASIDSVRFSFAGMEDWMGVFEQEIEFASDDINAYQLSVQRPKDIPFKINEEITGAWTFWTSRPYIKSRDIRLQQDNLFRLEFRPAVSLSCVLKEVWSFQLLYTLFTFEKTWVKWIYLGHNDKELRLFYRQRGVLSEEPERIFPLIQFVHVASKFEAAISAWTRLRPGLKQVMGILNANIGISDQYVHNDFLNIVQAVEAYHRRVLQDTDALKDSNGPRVTRILAAVNDPEDKQWLQNRLAFSHEPNLAARLKELLGVHSPALFEEPPSKKQMNKLIRNVVDKRNYYTHYDVSLENNEDETVKLIGLTKFMTLLLAYCLLAEIGFDSEFLQGKVYRRYRFRLSKGEKD